MHFLFALSHTTPLSFDTHTHTQAKNITETAGSLAAVARSQKVCTDPKCASDPVMAQSTPPSVSLLL